MKRGDMKINRLAILYSALFFIFIPNYLFAQTVTDKNNQTNLQVLEERIKQIEDKTNKQLEALEKKTDIQKSDLKEEVALRSESLEKQMNLYVWFVGIFITFILGVVSFVGYKVIIGWIKRTIEEKTGVVVNEYLEKSDIEGKIRQQGEEEVNKLLRELDIKGKEKIGELEKIRIDYENSLRSLNKIKEIDITKPLPEESKEDLAKFGDTLEKFKNENDYSFDDWFYKGFSEHVEKNYKTAIAYYLNASKLKPRDAGIYNNLGLTFSKLDKYKEAIEYYNKAIELKPSDVRYYENICESMIFTGDYKNALNFVNKAIALSSEMIDKAICFYLKSIIEKLLDIDTTDSEKELNKILENEFTIMGWEFAQMENWLKEADISEDKKRFITEKTEILKKRNI